jgi:hypothetical protein
MPFGGCIRPSPGFGFTGTLRPPEGAYRKVWAGLGAILGAGVIVVRLAAHPTHCGRCGSVMQEQHRGPVRLVRQPLPTGCSASIVSAPTYRWGLPSGLGEPVGIGVVRFAAHPTPLHAASAGWAARPNTGRIPNENVGPPLSAQPTRCRRSYDDVTRVW